MRAFQKPESEMGLEKARWKKRMTESIKELFNALPNTIDPCELCEKNENVRDKYKDKGCLYCCYFYPSQFELKKEKTNDRKKMRKV